MKIMDYIFSPSTTEVTISTLRVLIEDFLHDFCNLAISRKKNNTKNALPYLHTFLDVEVFTNVFSLLLRITKCYMWYIKLSTLLNDAKTNKPCILYVTRPVKINHVSTKITDFFHLRSVIT